jgi:MoaA/NifB/PqqE/SkfB family radical SAM enzyme
MCNQWGERGYYRNQANSVSEMPISKLISFLRSIESYDFFLNIHGGEPFYYSHMEELLDYLIETGRDVLFTTNGTLLDRYLPKLGRLSNAIYYVSIDGGQKTNDKIRGDGTFQKIKENLEGLKANYLEQSGLMPYLSMNLCVSECFKPLDIVQAYRIARELGFFNINYGLIWFTTNEAGYEYEQQLKKEFRKDATECWKALLHDFDSFDVNGVAQAIIKVRRNFANKVRLPYVSITPREARTAQQIENHFVNHGYSYDRERCLIPYCFIRIHSNGDAIFCQGYRDIIAGNVFRNDFASVFNSEIAQKFRKFCMHRRFSICSKCCGFYLSPKYDEFKRKGIISQ